MSNTIFITANWTTGALSQQTISRQYDNNRYAVQFIGYPEGDGTEELDLYLLVWMSTAPGQKPGEITPIQLNSDQWYISNYFTQQVQVIKFQLCVLNEAGTYEAHSPIFSGRIGDSLEHNGTSHDIDVSTLFDAYREYLNELIIRSGAVVIDSVPTQGSTNAVSSGGVYSALGTLQAQIPQIDSTLSKSGQAADAKATGIIRDNLKSVCPTPELIWILNRNVDGAGNISTNNYMAVTDAIHVGVGDRIIRKTPSYVNNKGIIGYLSEFNGDTFISRNAFNTFEQIITITNSNTTHVRIAFGRVSSSGVQISQNDVDTYFDVDIYRQAVPYVTYDADAFVNQGRISDLGYTSLSQCAKQGYYTFGSSDSLSDLPVGWGGGGLVIVYKNGNVIWQRLISTRYRFVRYGTTAKWRNEETLVYAQYVAESGENNSDAKLNVFIPRDLDNRCTLYQMGHCVDTSANADTWRIMFTYRVDTNGTQRKLTMTGEWECAVKLKGRSDFSGGIVHGDEVDTDVKVFVDGTLTDITTLNTFCRELKIVRHSNLYDPNDSTTIIAEHGAEYIYTVDGLKLNQSIKWNVSETLANCFLAMLPIIKIYSKYRYDDVSFNIIENDQTNYAVTIPNAKSITEYSTDYDCSVTMEIPSYPTGLTGGDCALITDNNGLNYNKVYFPVCTGGTSQIGEVWKSTTVFKNR